MPTPQPLTFMTWNSLDTSNANDSTVLSTAVVLFQCQTALVVKPSLLAQLSHLHVCNSSSPFYLGVVTSTILQNQLESHLSNIDIYLPSENDIFIFSKSCTVDVAKEAVALVLKLTVPVGEREIVLTKEVFESVTAKKMPEQNTVISTTCTTTWRKYPMKTSMKWRKQYVWTQSRFVLRGEEGKFVLHSDWTCSFCDYTFFGSFRCTSI